MSKTKIKITRCYDGTKSAREIMNEAVALKVRKKLNQEVADAGKREYNLNSSQKQKHP